MFCGTFRLQLLVKQLQISMVQCLHCAHPSKETLREIRIGPLLSRLTIKVGEYDLIYNTYTSK